MNRLRPSYLDLMRGISRDVAQTLWALTYDEKSNTVQKMEWSIHSLQSSVKESTGMLYTLKQINSAMFSLQRSKNYKYIIFKIASGRGEPGLYTSEYCNFVPGNPDETRMEKEQAPKYALKQSTKSPARRTGLTGLSSQVALMEKKAKMLDSLTPSLKRVAKDIEATLKKLESLKF